MDVLTRLEEMFLLAVLQLGENAYGVTIADKLTELTTRKWIISQVYVPLERLDNKGYLVSNLSEPVSERGGRSKRLYKLTEEGLKALIEVKSVERSLWNNITVLDLKKELDTGSM
jgi:DNA-binding PadR family transcriptional regulator